jgi:tRNA A-37 threonylcarbamoyl transferase component Bud32/tetratricopeptide (TPR) repeat protein
MSNAGPPESNATDDAGDPPMHEVDRAVLAALPGYVVEKKIGSGGMGTVFKARDLKHDREVAIKILRPEVASTLGHDRFLREIRTAARLVHPHIVSVFDSGVANGALYFVMPYIEGESLRERLNERGTIALDDSIRITRQIASALQHAHGESILHRDIKPENILISADGHAWLVDFGVALSAAGEPQLRLTAAGLLLGSPLYLSPEHLESRDVDGRADIYSLGCTLYEMLTGRAPFTGKSVQAVLLQHLTEEAKPASGIRTEVPRELDEILRKALAKQPADRFQTAGDFEAALAAISASAAADGLLRRPMGRRQLALGAFAFAAIWIALTIPRAEHAPATGPLAKRSTANTDTALYVVLPVVGDSTVPTREFESSVIDALTVWRGIDIADRPVPSTSQPNVPPTVEAQVHALAGATRAGRFVFLRVTSEPRGFRLTAELGDVAAPDVRLAKVRLEFPSNLNGAKPVFRALADSLLLRGIANECLVGQTGTVVLTAIRSCDAAFSALEDGNLRQANKFFGDALNNDRNYARAALWLSEIRDWIVANPGATPDLLRRAEADSNALTSRERALLRARQFQLQGNFESACSIYQRLTEANDNDFAPWLGLGDCHRRDERVVRSGNGWKFVSSYQRALDGYQRAFEIRPALLGAFSERGFGRIRWILNTSTSGFRSGRALAPDTLTFSAYPILQGDTIAFVPVPTWQFAQSGSGSWPAMVGAAVDRQRDVLRKLASQWAAQFPGSAAAQEGLAVALELQGDPAALNAVRRARELAADADHALQLATSEVWLRTKFGLPDDRRELRRARSLADSLLRAVREATPTQATLLSSLAILIGKPVEAARIARRIVSENGQLPTGLLEPTHALMAFAAAGALPDSMARLETQFEVALRNGVSPNRQAQVRADLLWQPAMIAVPEYVFRAFPAIASTGAFTAAQAAFLRHDTVEARAIMSRIQATRAPARPADLTIDAVLVSAWLSSQLGDSGAAEAQLDSVLNAVRWFPPGRMQSMPQTGSLLRAMMLRAELAARSGDRATASRWATPITVLWENSEPPLQKVLGRMRDLTKYRN